MRSNEFKSGFRVNLEFLRGKNKEEALQYFRSILGEPSDIEEYEGKVEYFRYDGEYQPLKEYSYGTYKTKDDGWFVDKIICEGCDGEDLGFYVKIDYIQKTVSELMEKFKVEEKDIMIFSYTWYNGSDEPRLMQPRKQGPILAIDQGVIEERCKPRNMLDSLKVCTNSTGNSYAMAA